MVQISSKMPLDQETFRHAMGCFATGVTVITVDYDGEIQGMTANAFSSVSIDPLLVLVCVDQQARTHAHLRARKRFGINVLSEDQRAISEHYAQANREPARAEQEAGARFDPTAHGTPVLHGALAYLGAKLGENSGTWLRDHGWYLLALAVLLAAALGLVVRRANREALQLE